VPIGRHTLAVEFHITDQCLVTQRDKIDIITNAFAVVVGDEFSVFGKFDQSADNRRWCDFIEIFLHLIATVRHRDACWLYWCRWQCGLAFGQVLFCVGFLLSADLFWRRRSPL
jgi:hypothetical protein